LVRMLYYNYRRRSGSPDENWNNVETFLSRLKLEETSVLSLNWDCVIEQGLARTQGVDNFEYGCDARPAFWPRTEMRIGFMTAAASTSCATNRQQKTARESRRRRASASLLCVHPSHGTGETLLRLARYGRGAPESGRRLYRQAAP
jgi:hypothetical protein